MIKAIQVGLMGSCCAILISCSVYMAASHEGVSSEDLFGCKARDCLVAQGCLPTGTSEENGWRTETFVFKTKKASATRAVIYSLLDLATIGLWEIAGTPIEGSGRDKTQAIKVFYEEGSTAIDRIELIKPWGTATPVPTPPGSDIPAEAKPLEQTSDDDPIVKLRRLKVMLDEGLIDQKDYENKKEEILERWRTRVSQ